MKAVEEQVNFKSCVFEEGWQSRAVTRKLVIVCCIAFCSSLPRKQHFCTQHLTGCCQQVASSSPLLLFCSAGAKARKWGLGFNTPCRESLYNFTLLSSAALGQLTWPGVLEAVPGEL